jgi:hypothetical protein
MAGLYAFFYGTLQYAEGLEMILHDLVELTPGGRPRFVARGGPDHRVP